MNKSNFILDNGMAILLSILTLGLAPFAPEPHIFGKVKWILGGGEGMQLMDYLDLLMHGLPWVFGIIYLYQRFVK
ncbi:MAG: hypothetical protein WAT92_09275 [Saprospiraceae bacterium]|nr:hypothetical protein [Saprospiraceae bacterium]MBP7643405.1 hypothetical protein [Saprospiraceae bacterium]